MKAPRELLQEGDYIDLTELSDHQISNIQEINRLKRVLEQYLGFVPDNIVIESEDLFNELLNYYRSLPIPIEMKTKKNYMEFKYKGIKVRCGRKN